MDPFAEPVVELVVRRSKCEVRSASSREELVRFGLASEKVEGTGTGRGWEGIFKKQDLPIEVARGAMADDGKGAKQGRVHSIDSSDAKRSLRLGRLRTAGPIHTIG